ncbi:uncharacterized protein LOC110944703 [Helianthus annuus]|uniref:uncharacterized protein LOC110944703 n=1 Tax=Helianthus annuus TaxID=4232 RepID=UPI000B90771B|nr:uncharacterized protein LOC110944703 [Helianthus annuus]
MEAFSSMIRKAVSAGILDGIKLPNDGLILSHLLYADDCVFMGKWSDNNLKSGLKLMRCFYFCAGLKININKSLLFGVGIESAEVERMASLLNCKPGNFPFVHLGVYVGSKMHKIDSWKAVFDVFESRLALWKASVLSIGGRVTLIKSVLESIPNYFLSLFKAPVGVVKGLEKITRKFLWG